MTLYEKFMDAGKDYLADLQLNTQSKATIAKYKYIYKSFGKYLSMLNGNSVVMSQAEVSPAQVSGWKQFLSKNRAGTNSIIHYLTCLKCIFRWCIAQGYFKENPVTEAAYPNHEKIKHDVLTSDEIRLILSGKIPRNTNKANAIRDLAVITLFIESGMRVSELINVRVIDLNYNAENIHVTDGKGGKERFVPFPITSQKRVTEYLKLRKQERNGVPIPLDGYVFASPDDESKPSSRQGISCMVERYVYRLTGHKKISAHDLRHAAASLWDDLGASLRCVQQALGHSSIQTTERVYVQILNRQKAAIELSNMMSRGYA